MTDTVEALRAKVKQLEEHCEALAHLNFSYLERAELTGKRWAVAKLRELHKPAADALELLVHGPPAEGLQHTGAEAAARVHLGVWLAAAPKRYWAQFPPDPTSSGRFADKWTIKLVEDGSDVGIADRTTWAEAVEVALSKATAFELAELDKG